MSLMGVCMAIGKWAGTEAQSGQAGLAKNGVKLGICIAVALPVMWALAGHLKAMDRALIAQSIAAISFEAIFIASLFTAVSFAAMARYDDMALRAMGRRLPFSATLKGGFVATSLSQGLGFGMIVGSFARWRSYRQYGLSLPQAAVMSSIVVAGFMFGFAVILALSALIDPTGLMVMSGLSKATVFGLSAMALLACFGVFLFSFWGCRLHVFGHVLSAPKWRMLRANILLAALDVIPAAIALWVLIPTADAPGLLAIIPVYLVALGLGLVSNTPGGIGVLELTCLMALPVTPPEALIAALIVFRGIFYGIPVILGLAMLLAREMRGEDRIAQDAPSLTMAPTPAGHLPKALYAPFDLSMRAEAGLALMGDKEYLPSPCGRAFLMMAQRGNSLIAVSDPVGDPIAWPSLLAAFKAEAAARYCAPVIYKASPGFGHLLEQAGYNLCQISVEAELFLAGFSLDGSDRRELRRKLRQAEKKGVRLTRYEPGQFGAARFASVAADWQGARTETGFSMGRFDAGYLARHRVIAAFVDERPVGFVSLWWSGDKREVSIDVMRLGGDAPDGTMHALCHEALVWAQDQGAVVFSLCAVPFAGLDAPSNRAETLLKEAVKRWPAQFGGQGLYRFKKAFRPAWTPRYIAGPTWLDAALGAWDASRLINRPDLDAPKAAQDTDMQTCAA